MTIPRMSFGEVTVFVECVPVVTVSFSSHLHQPSGLIFDLLVAQNLFNKMPLRKKNHSEKQFHYNLKLLKVQYHC